MNICFLIGKIISDIEFKFMFEKNKYAVSIFLLEIENNCNIQVKAYNKVADWCYQKLAKNDIVSIQGKLNNKMEIIIEDIYYL